MVNVHPKVYCKFYWKGHGWISLRSWRTVGKSLRVTIKCTPEKNVCIGPEFHIPLWPIGKPFWF